MTFHGERESGLADAAVHRPLAEFSGRALYKSIREQIAALIHAINSSHVFRDGNKRTSVAALVVLLDRNEWTVTAEDRGISNLLIAVATPAPPFDQGTELAVREIASWIRANTTKRNRGFGAIGTLEFLGRCERVGGSWKESGPSYVLAGVKGSVKISRSTRELSEGAARSYLSTVGLTEAYTGVPGHEFASDQAGNREIVARYKEALLLLAAHDRSDD